MSTAICYGSSLSSVFQPEQQHMQVGPMGVRKWRSNSSSQAWMDDPISSMGSCVLPNLPSADSVMDWSVYSFRPEKHLSRSYSYTEPTSVLDLSTSPGNSPGRSSCASASPDARSIQSYGSPRIQSFPGQSSFQLDEFQSSDKSMISRSSFQSNGNGDITNCWVDCIPEPEDVLSLPVFTDCDPVADSRGSCKVERVTVEQSLQYGADMSFDLVDMSLDSCSAGSFLMLPEQEMLEDPLTLLDGSDKLMLSDPLAELLGADTLVANPIKYDNDLHYCDQLGRPANFGAQSHFGGHGFISSGAQATPMLPLPALKNCGQLDSQQQLPMTSTQDRATWAGPEASQPQVENGLHLVHLLLGCAEAIEESNYDLARSFLSKLNHMANPFGDAMQRISVYFGDAINERIAKDLTDTENYTGETCHKHEPLKFSQLDTHVAYQAFYQLLPYVKFAHFTANQAILENVGSDSLIHIVDLDIKQGLQWPGFIQSLAIRQGGPPCLKITGIGADLTTLQQTGRRLCEFAASVHVPLEFHAVHERLENLHRNMFQLQSGETLAVNCGHVLNTLLESQADLDFVLCMVKSLKPSIVTLLEVDANHNVQSFMSRFVEALHHYSALFDCLEATLERNSSERLRIENIHFASEIRNILACEGTDRSLRHVRSDSWQVYFRQAGFRGLPLSEHALYQAKLLTGLYSGGTYKLAEEGAGLTLGWQDTPIVTVSPWTC